MGIVVTSCVAGPYQKVTTQIPIAQLTSLTARLPPAVSSLEACQTPALEFARRLTSLQLKAGILQPLTETDVPVLQSVKPCQLVAGLFRSYDLLIIEVIFYLTSIRQLPPILNYSNSPTIRYRQINGQTRTTTTSLPYDQDLT